MKFSGDVYSKGTPKRKSLFKKISIKWLVLVLVLVIAWFRVQLTINLTSGNLGASLISESLEQQKFSPLNYHESNLSLIASETIRLLVNHQLIPIAIESKSISLEKVCKKDFKVLSYIHCIVFFFQHQKTKS